MTRVLLAEDDGAFRHALTGVLDHAGFEVVAVADGPSALARLQAHAFDVIVSDLDLPGLTGLELLRTVRAHSPTTPVILVTGSPDVDSAIEAVALRAFHYFRKPVDPAQLLERVTTAARMSRLTRMQRKAASSLELPLLADDSALVEAFDDAMTHLYMAYQPIVPSWSLDAPVGYEALLRTTAKVLTTPSAVLAAALHLGREDDVLDHVARAVAGDLDAAPPIGLVFVNILPSDLHHAALRDADAPLAPWTDRVVLEVTERASLSSVSDVADTIGRLRALGYQLAVDDLGAGYASLNSIAELEPEYVKIDMALVRRIDQSMMRRRLVQSMIELCHDLGILVVAEGVETASERDTLLEMGTDLLQGFLFGRPGRLSRSA